MGAKVGGKVKIKGRVKRNDLISLAGMMDEGDSRGKRRLDCKACFTGSYPIQVNLEIDKPQFEGVFG